MNCKMHVICGSLLLFTLTAHAQEGNCTASLRLARLGAPTGVDTRQSMMSGVGRFYYRIHATADEQQCVNVSFNVVQRYKDKDGKPAVLTNPGSLRFTGGEGAQSGELMGRRQDSDMQVTVEDIVCKRC